MFTGKNMGLIFKPTCVSTNESRKNAMEKLSINALNHRVSYDSHSTHTLLKSTTTNLVKI